jgi:flavorubredoxin
VVANHAEQDHSGTLLRVLEKYPQAKALCTPRCKGMLLDFLLVPEDRIMTVEDKQTVSLGDRTIEFIHAAWVHWPETMLTYLREERILFACDLFGSHLATTDLYVTDECRVYEAAKRYYAEIMMPFRKIIQKNLEKLAPFRIERIAPSHGPLYDRPELIIQAYQEWISDRPRNLAVIPFVSMHGSTEMMVRHLVSALIEKGVDVCQFSLPQTDIGKLAISLVDAATVVLGAPTVHVGAHPAALYAAGLVNMLRPKARFATVIGSYGWSSKAVEQITGAIPNLRAEVLNPVLCKGLPREADFKALDELALTILKKHQEIGIV